MNLEDIFYAKFDETKRSLDLDNPKTLNDKLVWLSLYDDMNYLKPICADKIKVRDYAKEKIGKDICVPLLKVYDSPNDIVLSELPNKFVLKTNNGYNQNLICTDKSKLNENEVRKTFATYLRNPHGIKSCELHYLFIKRKCFAEKLLERDDKQPISQTDYKFFCFNGEPKLMHMVLDYHTPKQRMHHYDMNGKFRPDIDRNGFNVRLDLQKQDRLPKNFDLMKEYARKLAAPFRFVRVDFYEVNGKVYLGEMTFTPAAFGMKFKNPNTDRMLGDMLKL